ncbi:MAG: DHA2 family efflux MFS transporter permease subunit [Caulobacteraceae bacterium]
MSARRLGEGRKLAIFLAMSVGMFMALLDIQIVAASVSAIQAGLSAGPGEIDWLQTAYLMAEIVMIPLSAFLAEALSTRWLFVLSAGLFTGASLLCGLTVDIRSMAVLRALQGFVGGAMIPLVFATGFALFGGEKRAMVTAALGVISTLAPALGPTIGGWITEVASWRWLFFINIAPGLAVTAALVVLGPIDLAQPRRLAHIDWLHVAALAGFLGGLQYVLQEGPGRGWFDDRAIATVAWFAFVAAAVFFERCAFSTNPIVSLAPFGRRGFGPACLASAVIGFGLYTTVYLTPLFLARVRGFSSLQIGLTVCVAGVFMTAAAPLAAALVARTEQRWVLAIGLCLFAASLWMISQITPQWGFWQLFGTQAVRGVAVLFCMAPAVGMALGAVEENQLLGASGLNNLSRNLGGAIGIALVNTGLIDFARAHGERLSEALGAAPQKATATLLALAVRLSTRFADPVRQLALAGSELRVKVEAIALTEAFSDIFRLSAFLFIASLAIVPFCPRGSLAGERR